MLNKNFACDLSLRNIININKIKILCQSLFIIIWRMTIKGKNYIITYLYAYFIIDRTLHYFSYLTVYF